jgi:tetratricopeptide (TPR) repeat protein
METISDKDIITKLEESINAQQQIKSISKVVDKIEEKEGTKIEEIRAENIQISRNELSLKKYNLKGNEHLYKKEYSNAISWYDKAIELDPNYIAAWNNKGLALSKSGKYEEAIEHYNKATELDPNLTLAQVLRDLAYKQLGIPTFGERKIKYYTSDGKPVYE